MQRRHRGSVRRRQRGRHIRGALLYGVDLLQMLLLTGNFFHTLHLGLGFLIFVLASLGMVAPRVVAAVVARRRRDNERLG